MNIVKERKKLLSEEFGCFDDPQERFEYIISRSKHLPPLDKKFKTEENLVKGCVSGLWLVKTFENGKCRFKSDADSIITRGIAHLVCDMYSDLTPEQILSFDPAFLKELGITEHLSPNRRNGLSKLSEKILSFAEECKNKNI